MSILNHFHDSEFDCKCGNCGMGGVEGIGEMSLSFLHKLDQAREFLDMPISLNSAQRCMRHNIAVGSKDTSSHLNGHAVDIHVPNSLYRYSLIVALVKAGFDRIGVAKDFIHTDDDPDKPAGVIWVYD